MISLYSGTPGSGKSLHCASTIITWSRLGYPVIGNFPVDLSKYKRAAFTYCPNDKLTPDFLINYSRQRFGAKAPKEGSILLVIDECQLLFNAREWQQSSRAQWLSFFTQHRKLGYDIILIAQFDRMVDRQIRSLIEYEYIHRKMSNFGWQGKILSLFFGGKTFIAVKRWYPLHERLGAEMIHARKNLYSIYDSYATFDSDAVQPKSPSPAPPAPDNSGTDLFVSTSKEQNDRTVDLMDADHAQKQEKLCAVGGRIHSVKVGKLTVYSGAGKFLLPGAQSETGWKNRPA